MCFGVGDDLAGHPARIWEEFVLLLHFRAGVWTRAQDDKQGQAEGGGKWSCCSVGRRGGLQLQLRWQDFLGAGVSEVWVHLKMEFGISKG